MKLIEFNNSINNLVLAVKSFNGINKIMKILHDIPVMPSNKHIELKTIDGTVYLTRDFILSSNVILKTIDTTKKTTNE